MWCPCFNLLRDPPTRHWRTVSASPIASPLLPLTRPLPSPRAACEYCLLSCFFPCGACYWGKTTRSKLRKMYGLSSKGSCKSDCCIHLCEHSCALCQERREINFRQHALATTQAMVGNQMIRGTGGVIAQPNPYPPPPGMSPASSGPAMFISDNGSGNLVTLPSGQVVLMTPVMQAPAPAQYAAPSPTSNGAPTTQLINK